MELISHKALLSVMHAIATQELRGAWSPAVAEGLLNGFANVAILTDGRARHFEAHGDCPSTPTLRCVWHMSWEAAIIPTDECNVVHLLCRNWKTGGANSDWQVFTENAQVFVASVHHVLLGAERFGHVVTIPQPAQVRAVSAILSRQMLDQWRKYPPSLCSELAVEYGTFLAAVATAHASAHSIPLAEALASVVGHMQDRCRGTHCESDVASGTVSTRNFMPDGNQDKWESFTPLCEELMTAFV